MDNFAGENNFDCGFDNFEDDFQDPKEMLPTRHQMEDELQDLEIEDKSKNYTWNKIIGQGTFGTVYQAYCVNSRKQVAIKKVFQDPKYRNREFSIVVDLDHPNTIKVHDYFFSYGDENPLDIFLNIVMDYMPVTLYKVLRYYKKTSIRFPPILMKLLVYQMLRGLAYLKGLSICHRDIKPQNILLDSKDLRLAICDFGSAKHLEPGEPSIAYICSRFYRSPELILGAQTYGCEIDMWATGCVVGEMLIGEPFFNGNNNKEQFLRIVNTLGAPTEADLGDMGYTHKLNIPDFAPLTLEGKIGKNIDPMLLDLLSKMLAYSPLKRIDPFEALTHPYFDELRAQRILINNRGILDLFDFRDEEVGSHSSLLSKLVPTWYTKKQT